MVVGAIHELPLRSFDQLILVCRSPKISYISETKSLNITKVKKLKN